MKDYFFFHLYFKPQLWIYQASQRAKTALFIFLWCPLTQALLVYEYANIYCGICVFHPVALSTD